MFDESRHPRARGQFVALAENHAAHFQTDPAVLARKLGRPVKVETVPMSRIRPTVVSPTTLAVALPQMRQAAAEGDLRAPVTLIRHPDGSHSVFNGNAPYAVARAAGWKAIPAIITGSAAEAQALKPYVHKDTVDTFWERMGALGHERTGFLTEALIEEGEAPGQVVHFDLTKHPRSRTGEFAAVIGALPKFKKRGGGNVQLHGTGTPHRIERTKRGFQVTDVKTGKSNEFYNVADTAHHVIEHAHKAQADADFARERAKFEADRQKAKADVEKARQEEHDKARKVYEQKGLVDHNGHRIFHRLEHDQKVIDDIVNSSELHGAPRRNTFASDRPAAKAYPGPLPKGKSGVEFTAHDDAPVDPKSLHPEWSMSGGDRGGAVRLEDGKAKLKIKVRGHVAPGPSARPGFPRAD